MQTENIYIDLIIKFLANQTDEHEKISLFAWIEQNPENEQIFNEHKKVWDSLDDISFKAVTQIDTESEWQKFQCETKKYPQIKTTEIKSKPAKSMYYKIAAVLLVFIVLQGVFILGRKKEVSVTADNSVITQSLPDGTKVTLNKKTVIKFNKKYNKTERLVKLEGEAEFDVKSDKFKKFKVLAGNLIIEAVGTKFTVKTHKENTQVFVTEGVVKTYTLNDNYNYILLKKDESVVYDKNIAKPLKKAVNENNYLAWKTKNFKFENTPLSEITKYIEDVYDVQIIFKNPELKKCKLTVSFNNQSVESIMKVLENILGIKISIKGKVIELNGNTC